MKQEDNGPNLLSLKEQLQMDQNSLILQKGTLLYKQDHIQNKYNYLCTDRKGFFTSIEQSHNKRFIVIENSLGKLNIYFRLKLVKSLIYQYTYMTCKFGIDDYSIYIALCNPIRLIEISALQGFKLIKQNLYGIFDNDKAIEIKCPDKNFMVLKQYYKIVICNNESNIIIEFKDYVWSFDCINNLNTQIVISQNDNLLSLYNNDQLQFQQRVQVQLDRSRVSFNAGLIKLKFFGIKNKIVGTTNRDLIIWSIDHDKKQFIQALIIKGDCFSYNLQFCPHIIIIVCKKQIYAYEFKKDNQDQIVLPIRQITQCQQIKIIHDLSKFASQTNIIEIIR